MTGLWVLLAVIVVGLGYIRLAPSDPARWHVAPRVTADEDLRHGVKRLIDKGQSSMGQLDAIVRSTPRTVILAGSVEEGMITYVTRSRWMGFPDYTTVEQDGDRLKLYARLRFGRSDFGVNMARVEDWIAQLRRVQSAGEG